MGRTASGKLARRATRTRHSVSSFSGPIKFGLRHSASAPSGHKLASISLWARSNATSKAASDASNPRPPRRTVLRNSSTAKGNTSAPAIAPNRLAEIIVPALTAIRSISKAITRLALLVAARCTSVSSAMPFPGTAFSTSASARCDDAISTVRSGETKPRMMARPASIHSAATTMSTSASTGLRAKTGWRPVLGSISI